VLVSLIIPAHDEERLIGETLRRLRAAAEGATGDGVEFEVVVADDASSDATGAIARAAGARVARHERRQIAATRNLGARASRGELLIFVDADTWPNAEALRQAVEAMRGGAVGGGASMVFEGRVPLYVRALVPAVNLVFRLRRKSGGAFFFCTRAALQRAGRTRLARCWACCGGWCAAARCCVRARGWGCGTGRGVARTPGRARIKRSD